MKQLGLGIAMLTTDRQEMYPPAVYSSGDVTYQLTWDDLIHRYIGGTGSDMDLQMGMTLPEVTPKVLRCPADRIEFPKAETWLNNFASRRSYAMNWAGPGFMLDSASAPLPAPNWGIGVFFNARNFAPSSINWEPRGYKVSQVPDQAGTIMLAELANGGRQRLALVLCRPRTGYSQRRERGLHPNHHGRQRQCHGQHLRFDFIRAAFTAIQLPLSRRSRRSAQNDRYCGQWRGSQPQRHVDHIRRGLSLRGHSCVGNTYNVGRDDGGY
jgi:hypothetical protein